MSSLSRVWSNSRRSLSRLAAQRAARLEVRRPRAAERWLRLAVALAPRFDFVHRDLCAHLRRRNDRLGAVAVAQSAVERFTASADAWVLLGETLLSAYRPREALAAYDCALGIEERAEVAMIAGELHSRESDHAAASARYARAYAAGAGPKALRANAEALLAAGDVQAAAQARAMWERETGRKWDGPDG